MMTLDEWFLGGERVGRGCKRIRLSHRKMGRWWRGGREGFETGDIIPKAVYG